MKVLIAEDDPVAAEHLAAVLHGMGHEVRAFTNGMEAWNSFDADPTRIIISDWDMPGMDGLALCRMVRSRPKTEYAYFILITAIHTDEDNYNLAIQSDVDDFLIKPLDRFAIWRRLHVARRILNFATESNRLQLLLPICMYCKKIRDNQHDWQPMEVYINRHTGTDFSHGVCPDCAADFLSGKTPRKPGDIG
jgi:sigma-B regulation protein RsbU (phosphoserine phosphatase)